MTDTLPGANLTLSHARFAGAALLAAAAASVALMAHHPTNAHPASLPPIHGALLAVLCVHALGLLYLCALRGLGRVPILAGMVAYAVAMFANIGAGLLNGFITPGLLADGPQIATPEILAFAGAANQSLAVMAVFAAGSASALWGLDLIRDSSVRVRLTGLAGIVAGLVPPLLLMTRVLEMDVTGAFVSYSVQSAWAMLVGLLLVTGKAGRSIVATGS